MNKRGNENPLFKNTQLVFGNIIVHFCESYACLPYFLYRVLKEKQEDYLLMRKEERRGFFLNVYNTFLPTYYLFTNCLRF